MTERKTQNFSHLGLLTCADYVRLHHHAPLLLLVSSHTSGSGMTMYCLMTTKPTARELSNFLTASVQMFTPVTHVASFFACSSSANMSVICFTSTCLETLPNFERGKSSTASNRSGSLNLAMPLSIKKSVRSLSASVTPGWRMTKAQVR